jgi:hypothetical protein
VNMAKRFNEVLEIPVTTEMKEGVQELAQKQETSIAAIVRELIRKLLDGSTKKNYKFDLTK